MGVKNSLRIGIAFTNSKDCEFLIRFFKANKIPPCSDHTYDLRIEGGFYIDSDEKKIFSCFIDSLDTEAHPNVYLAKDALDFYYKYREEFNEKDMFYKLEKIDNLIKEKENGKRI